jgi:hypothetical protein
MFEQSYGSIAYLILFAFRCQSRFPENTEERIVIDMEGLKDLLGKYSPQEPAEVLAIKQYIEQTFRAASSVGMQGEAIVITVSSASLANTLRFHISKIRQAAATDKKIVFRIG